MAAHPNSQPIVFVLDDHPDVRAGIQALLETVHIKSRAFACVRDFRRERTTRRSELSRLRGANA